MDEQNKTPCKVWAFVIGLNVVGLLGATYLQSKGINVFAIRGGSWLNKKITFRYAFTLLKMKKAEGLDDLMDLAKEVNLLWHQIVSKKSKNTPSICCQA